MIRFAICDDEPVMIKHISSHISKYMETQKNTAFQLSSFSNGSSLLESSNDFDVIFLDIQMDCPNGMETARKLRQKKNNGLLIFVTVLKEYVFDAFEVQAYDYLLKPLDDSRFERTMDRILVSLSQRANQTILVQKGNSCEVLLLSGILYCEVLGRKIYIHQNNGNIVDYYDKLADLERRVDGRFFRCHRSYLVNLDFVCGCSAGRVILSQGDTIPVSRLRERELAQALLRHIKKRGS